MCTPKALRTGRRLWHVVSLSKKSRREGLDEERIMMIAGRCLSAFVWLSSCHIYSPASCEIRLERVKSGNQAKHSRDDQEATVPLGLEVTALFSLETRIPKQTQHLHMRCSLIRGEPRGSEC